MLFSGFRSFQDEGCDLTLPTVVFYKVEIWRHPANILDCTKLVDQNRFALSNISQNEIHANGISEKANICIQDHHSSNSASFKDMVMVHLIAVVYLFYYIWANETGNIFKLIKNSYEHLCQQRPSIHVVSIQLQYNHLAETRNVNACNKTFCYTDISFHTEIFCDYNFSKK